MRKSLDLEHHSSPRVFSPEDRYESPQDSSGNEPSPRRGDVEDEGQDIEDDNDDSDVCRQHDSKDARPRKPHLQVSLTTLPSAARLGVFYKDPTSSASRMDRDVSQDVWRLN